MEQLLDFVCGGLQKRDKGRRRASGGVAIGGHGDVARDAALETGGLNESAASGGHSDFLYGVSYGERHVIQLIPRFTSDDARAHRHVYLGCRACACAAHAGYARTNFKTIHPACVGLREDFGRWNADAVLKAAQHPRFSPGAFGRQYSDVGDFRLVERIENHQAVDMLQFTREFLEFFVARIWVT